MVTPTRDNRSAKQITRKAIPLEKAYIHKGNKNANIDFLAANITPSGYPCLFRVQVILPAAGKFTAKISDGTDELTAHFNGGSNLVADSLYIFDLLIHEDDEVNFQSDQNQDGHLLRVQEITWGVQ